MQYYLFYACIVFMCMYYLSESDTHMLNRNNLLRSDQSLYKRYVGNKDRTTLVDKEQYFTNLAEKFYRANLNPDTWCISYLPIWRIKGSHMRRQFWVIVEWCHQVHLIYVTYLQSQGISHEKAASAHSWLLPLCAYYICYLFAESRDFVFQSRVGSSFIDIT